MIRIPLARSAALAASIAAALAATTMLAQPAPAAPATPPAVAPAPMPAPPPTDTEVFVASLDLASGKVGEPRNLTQRPGYDNQPAFLADGSALLYVVAGEGGNSEVWRVELASGARAQVTATPEAEYSPTPLADGSGFSAVRVESPGAAEEAFTESQRLFRYGFDGKPIGPVLAAVRRVGYHAWIDERHVALFLVGGGELKLPHSLVLATLGDAPGGDKVVTLAKEIGSALGRSPEGRVTYVDQGIAEAWSIATLMPGDAKPTVVVATPRFEGEAEAARSQHFVWLPDGTLLMAHGDALLRFDPRQAAAGFVAFARFAGLPGEITRLALSRDGRQLAFVVRMRAPPVTRGIRG